MEMSTTTRISCKREIILSTTTTTKKYPLTIITIPSSRPIFGLSPLSFTGVHYNCTSHYLSPPISFTLYFSFSIILWIRNSFTGAHFHIFPAEFQPISAWYDVGFTAYINQPVTYDRHHSLGCRFLGKHCFLDSRWLSLLFPIDFCYFNWGCISMRVKNSWSERKISTAC